jgi:hypothetical protein
LAQEDVIPNQKNFHGGVRSTGPFAAILKDQYLRTNRSISCRARPEHAQKPFTTAIWPGSGGWAPVAVSTLHGDLRCVATQTSSAYSITCETLIQPGAHYAGAHYVHTRLQERRGGRQYGFRRREDNARNNRS